MFDFVMVFDMNKIKQLCRTLITGMPMRKKEYTLEYFSHVHGKKLFTCQ